MVYAVIDTNIFVSAFITKNATASTRRVINSLFAGKIKPLYNDEIIEEYSEVLHRSKFHLADKDIQRLLYFIQTNGIDSSRFPYDGDMPDEDDRLQKISIIERQEPGILVDIKQTLLKPLPIRQRVNPLMQLIPHFKRARVEHVRNAVQPQIIVAISEPVRIFVTIRQDNIKNIEHLLPVQVSQMLFKPPPQIVLSPCCLWVDAAR